MRMPNKSVEVVTNGPEAIAGSTSSFLRMMGISVPKEEAVNIEKQIAKPTTKPSLGGASITFSEATIPSRSP